MGHAAEDTASCSSLGTVEKRTGKKETAAVAGGRFCKAIAAC
jgi:hypothetical protein